MAYKDLRKWVYKRKLSGKRAIQLKSLPPTEEAGLQHILRIYCQVQEWLGNDIQPEVFGWMINEGSFEPNQGFSTICPTKISKNISCGCKTGCKAACTCVKNGMSCTAVCKCNDVGCTNKHDEESEVSDNEQDNDI